MIFWEIGEMLGMFCLLVTMKFRTRKLLFEKNVCHDSAPENMLKVKVINLAGVERIIRLKH